MLKPARYTRNRIFKLPAAFGRLCVETMANGNMKLSLVQPPSGGCVLKLPYYAGSWPLMLQPPSGGCVLKLVIFFVIFFIFFQPPSGGCVLKQKGMTDF